MKISTKGRYALRMILDMYQYQDRGSVALKDIAERQNVSRKYLEQIALTLSAAGVMKGSRGHLGGYRMVGEAKDYTVYDVLSIMEGSMHPVSCLDTAPNKCERCNGCETLYIWRGLDERISGYLKSMTVQDVLDRIKSKE